MRLRSVAVAAACIGMAGCGGSSGPTATTVHSAQVSPAPAAVAPSSQATASVGAAKPPAPNRGSLPQTDQRPSAGTPAFRAEMTALWNGIRSGSLQPAMLAFFPKGAYLQLKTIYNASSDYADRLVGDYSLDIQAAHALLGAGAANAALIEVRVPGEYAHWVDPGACDNGVGYWEVPNARVVYSAGGQVHSFGIASMISWRGVWYVVHLGTVVRQGAGGVVDDPSSGAGVSAPSSTC